MKDAFVGFPEALRLTLENIAPLNAVEAALTESTHRVSARDVHSRVDSPSANASLKDGYAVRSEEVAHASPDTPATLRVTDTAAAGSPAAGLVAPGSAVRILTGARIPAGADAVVPEEFTRRLENRIMVVRAVKPGQNILQKGIDVRKGERILDAGTVLEPGRIGLLAAAGHATVWIIPPPRVAIVSTGDEIVLPGHPLVEGKLYASNLMTLHAWCRRFGMKTHMNVVADDRQKISDALDRAAKENDAVLTSGGAWSGDRDLVAQTLKDLGWDKIYHRVRMGPGKAVGFGLLYGKPIFLLPGGPPSNLMAFLFLALPVLFKLAGNRSRPLPETPLQLGETICGQKDWTQFLFGTLEKETDPPGFRPIQWPSRLKSMAAAHCVVSIPEGVERIAQGEKVPGTLLI